MKELSEFHENLYTLFDSWRAYLNSSQMPKMHELYRVQQTVVHSILGLFLKKGIIRDDPYKADPRVDEVEEISIDAFQDNETEAVIGLRLFKYEMALDYINNFYQFTTDDFNLDKIRRLSILNRTFDWSDLTRTSVQPNTRGLTELVFMIRNGSDAVASNMLNENLIRIGKDLPQITSILKELSDFHRQSYKVQVRRLLIDPLIVDRDFAFEDRVELQKLIKTNFKSKMKNQPYFTELIDEIIQEDIGPEKVKLQKELLDRIQKRLNVAPEKKKTVVDLKILLFDCIRILGSISPQLDEVIKKIEENHQLIETQNTGFWHRLKKLFKKAFSLNDEQLLIELEIQETAMQPKERSSIDYYLFLDDLRRRSRLYSDFAVKTSAIYVKIVSSPEAQILNLLAQHIEEMQKILKQLVGLDSYFKFSAIEINRSKIRGFKVEVSTMKNTILKANQKRFEYVSLVEEQEQMKKLGIKE